jgi:uncharacterized membrane protein
MTNRAAFFLALIVLSLIFTCAGQLAPNENDGQTSPRELPQSYLYLSWGILAFGLCLVLLLGIIIYKKNAFWDQEATRVFTVTIVIISGLFLMTAGYSSQQVAPMFGLLGTMIGYIFGKSSAKEQNREPLS